MLGRHLCLVRAGLAAGLLSGFTWIGGSMASAQAQPQPQPEPQPRAAVDSEPSAAPVGLTTQTVNLVAASRAGELDVLARGQGQERVHLSIRNRSARRLNVVVPPGLVAASAAGQGRGGGAGAGGGMQSMGLGSAANREGAFGEFRGTGGPAGLQSIAAVEEARAREIAVPVGETVEITIPAVCLNYGKPTPTARDTFKLMDVEEYSTDPRVRKALRSLALYGTSIGVAQSVMWRVCNDLPFETMYEQSGKVMNAHEVALAERFVEAMDASTSSDLIDPAAFSNNRIFVQIRGEATLGGEAKRLATQIDGMRLLGLPLQIVESEKMATVSAPALLVKVSLTGSDASETRGSIVVSSCSSARLVAAAWQGRVPRQLGHLGARRRRPGQGARSVDRRRVCDGQAGPQNAR